jgi:UDP-N-acetylmuramyl pentapeptide phosphotransferase/UDP-N-acetylglucosamine-1-phosphate transferase
MESDLIPSLTAFLLALALTPAAALWARKGRLLDMPDGVALKIHRRPVPNAGGLALAAAVLPAFLLYLHREIHPSWAIGVVAGGSLFSLLLGLADDLTTVNPLTRLLAQTGLGASVALAGLRPGLCPSPFADSLLAVCIVVGGMNALNLLDGMDGLAAGVAAICAAAFAALSWARGDAASLALASTILGAFLGFLPYNFHPASIFLGNSGSYLTGFLTASLMILGMSGSPTPAGCTGSLLIVGLPVADTALAIIRRVKKGRGIMTGDREHFYDKLLRWGFSQRESALIGYTAAATFAAWVSSSSLHRGETMQSHFEIPLSAPDVTERDIRRVAEVLRSPHLSLGPRLAEFEREFARYVGTRFAVAVNSGTSALHLAVKGLAIGDGDAVITTPFSFIASANCLLFEGAAPVFVDIEPDTFNIDPAGIIRYLATGCRRDKASGVMVDRDTGRHVRAVLPVHVFGHPCEMDALREIADEYRCASSRTPVRRSGRNTGARRPDRLEMSASSASIRTSR